MSSQFRFEDFGSSRKKTAQAKTQADVSKSQLQAAVSQAADAARAQGYETGYKAGWDDAVKAEEDTKERVGAELARNLQDLGFTFHEARTHVIKALEPLLLEMTEKVLPDLVAQTLGQSILEEIIPLAESASDAPVEILICPDNRAAIEPLMTSSLTMPFEIVEEPSLSTGQVFLRLGAKERKIDLDGAIAKMRDAIDATFTLNKEAMING